MNRATAPLFNGAVLHIYNVKSENGIAELGKRLKCLQSEVNSVKAELSDEQLKRVSGLITAYERVVEGKYIDNLISGQRKRDKAFNNTFQII